MAPKRVPSVNASADGTDRRAEIGRGALRIALAVLFAAAGAAHLAVTDKFMAIMPDWVPFPRDVIIATGACEIAGAAALLSRRLRTFAGWALALYALCVWPANFKHAVYGIEVGGLPISWWYHGPRLAAQPLIIWGCLYAAGVIDWPFVRNKLR